MAGEDRAYIAWLHTLPCCADWSGRDCRGRIEAHHTGRRGMGQRAHDHTAIPLCTQHHRSWHDCSGMFRDWTRDDRRDWADRMAATARAAWERR